MVTQLEFAQKGKITKEMRFVAKNEFVSPEMVLNSVAKGELIIPANKNHLEKQMNPLGIGKGLSTKINANIGASKVHFDLNAELEKLRYCTKYGADTVMDLSTGGELDKVRKTLLNESEIPLGTVPIYQVVEETSTLTDWTLDDYLNVIEKQAKQGVDYFTIHSGLLQEAIPLTKKRITGVVSRGGSILVAKMLKEKKENVLYENFDEILSVMQKYDVTLSLGDGLRPGCIADSTDVAQLHELKTIGALVKRCWKNGVQVMVEGPGHVPINEIEKNVKLQKEWCHNAPFYVLGPLVTDIALGYDHITSAIGGALAGYYGTDMLCYVTPKEHLGLPCLEDVKQGIIASKIAAHAADIAKNVPRAKERDKELSKARFAFDWEKQFELSLDPETAKRFRSDLKGNTDFCSMCGAQFCSMRNYRKATGK
jgi:phosphomethylpyrimidine synthase